ncbi:rod shape-determining protein MreD [Thalassotalea ganghwensis]
MFAHNGLIILLTFIAALTATIIPLPLAVDAFRPDWALVAVLYWCLALPSRINVGTAWLLGLIIDILLGSVLGIHAAAMAISCFIIASNFQKIRNFSVWQQALIIGVLSALYHLLVFWFQRFLTDVVFLPSYLYPVITTVILWPWAFLLLRKIRRHFKIK